MNWKRFSGWCVICFSAASFCFAQEQIQPSKFDKWKFQNHRYWDTANKTLLIVHASLEAADFSITHINLANGGRELNPVGRALCESGTPGQLVFFGGRMAGVTGISYLLHRLGRHKLERMFIMVANGDSAEGLSYSLIHR